MDIDTEDLKIKGVLKFRQMSPLNTILWGRLSVCLLWSADIKYGV